MRMEHENGRQGEKNTRYIQKAGALNVRITREDAMGGMHVIIKKVRPTIIVGRIRLSKSTGGF